MFVKNKIERIITGCWRQLRSALPGQDCMDLPGVIQ